MKYLTDEGRIIYSTDLSTLPEETKKSIDRVPRRHKEKRLTQQIEAVRRDSMRRFK